MRSIEHFIAVTNKDILATHVHIHTCIESLLSVYNFLPYALNLHDDWQSIFPFQFVLLQFLPP